MAKLPQRQGRDGLVHSPWQSGAGFGVELPAAAAGVPSASKAAMSAGVGAALVI